MPHLRVLLRSSIPFAADDWHVGRFSLLGQLVGRFAEVTARNSEPDHSGNDPLLVRLDRDRFDELWLFGVDAGNGLSQAECAAVNRFQAQGGGVLTARDHADMGRWLRSLERIGAANYFHDPSCCEPSPTVSLPTIRDSQHLLAELSLRSQRGRRTIEMVERVIRSSKGRRRPAGLFNSSRLIRTRGRWGRRQASRARESSLAGTAP